MNYCISPEAQQDLAAIWHFIALDNPTAADRVVDAVKSDFHQLTQWPETGRSRQELAPGLRSLVVRKYRRYLILYRLRPDAVEIVRVLHGSRNLKRIFKRGRQEHTQEE